MYMQVPDARKVSPALTVLLLLLAVARPAPAQTPLRDPGIPHGESATYRVTTDSGKTFIISESVTVGEEQGRRYYQITRESADEETVSRIFSDTMVAFYTHTWSRSPGYTSESSTVIQYEHPIESPHIVLMGMESLNHSLRGFPFESADLLYIKPFGVSDEEGAQFAMKVQTRKPETLEIGGRRIECYKLQLRVAMTGVFSILNGLIPKSYFWYSVAAPHYLAAYEINSGRTGTDKSRGEIIDYSGWR
jgi:hypothetical protein